jgi:hypothetical protein
MRPLKIECANPNWKIALKKNLQEGIEVDLLDLDYLADWQFCDIVAFAHSMTMRLDTRQKTGKFRRCGPPSDSNKGIVLLPHPSHG